MAKITNTTPWRPYSMAEVRKTGAQCHKCGNNPKWERAVTTDNAIYGSFQQRACNRHAEGEKSKKDAE